MFSHYYVHYKHGNRLLSMWYYFHEHNICTILQFKHLLSKTPDLEIFKMWSTIVVFSKLTEIFKNLFKFQFI